MINKASNKALSQNFLTNKHLCKIIVDFADLNNEKNVLEVGPGHGALTEFILEKSASLLAVELDKNLYAELKTKFQANKNFEILNEDFLIFDFNNLARDKNWIFISNLPYHISSAIFFKLLYSRSLFSKIIIMLQKEFALRILAKASQKNKKDIGTISVASWFSFDVKKLMEVSGSAFSPQAKVDSLVLELIPKKSEILHEKEFYLLVQKLFSFRRKSLSSIINRHVTNIAIKNVDLSLRLEQLSIQDWQQVYKEIF